MSCSGDIPPIASDDIPVGDPAGKTRVRADCASSTSKCWLTSCGRRVLTSTRRGRGMAWHYRVPPVRGISAHTATEDSDLPAAQTQPLRSKSKTCSAT